MNEEIKLDDVFVFFKYDLFPYLSWGEATKCKIFNGKMNYYIPSHQGWYAPVLLTSHITGKLLAEILDELTTERREKKREIDMRYAERLKVTLEGFGGKIV